MRAVEAAHRFGNSCADCEAQKTDAIKRRLGCGRDPNNRYELKGPPYNWTSPALADEKPMLECPTGYILREARWVFDVIDAVNRADACGPIEWARMPRFYHHAVRVVNGERQRLRDEDRAKENLSHG